MSHIISYWSKVKVGDCRPWWKRLLNREPVVGWYRVQVVMENDPGELKLPDGAEYAQLEEWAYPTPYVSWNGDSL